jgi:glycosyltransferase involved in cell wall biosynthesis
LRLLFLADALDRYSLTDSNLWTADLAAAFAERGHRVQVICVESLESWQEPFDPPGVTISRPTPETFEAELGDALRQVPDVVHVSTREPLSARVREILRELPVLLDVHDYWPICPNEDLLQRPNFEPCAFHYPQAPCGPCAGLSRLRTMEPRRDLASIARIVVAHSHSQRRRLVAGLRRPVELVSYGVDPQRYRARAGPPLETEVLSLLTLPPRPRVIFLGPPSHARGASRVLDLLVACRARLGDVEFVIAGRDLANPDWHHMLVAEAREMGLGDSVRCLIRVPETDLPALFAASDVAAAPWIGHEPGGTAILQAMATGLPVVGSPVGALAEIVRHGHDGLLIPGDLTSPFSNALCGVLSDNMARIVLGESARLHAIEKHDRARSLVNLEGLYDRLRGPAHAAVAA